MLEPGQQALLARHPPEVLDLPSAENVPAGRREEHRILLVFPAGRYPADNDAPERDVRRAVPAAVIDGKAVKEMRDAMTMVAVSAAVAGSS